MDGEGKIIDLEEAHGEANEVQSIALKLSTGTSPTTRNYEDAYKIYSSTRDSQENRESQICIERINQLVNALFADGRFINENDKAGARAVRGLVEEAGIRVLPGVTIPDIKLPNDRLCYALFKTPNGVFPGFFVSEVAYARIGAGDDLHEPDPKNSLTIGGQMVKIWDQVPAETRLPASAGVNKENIDLWVPPSARKSGQFDIPTIKILN